MKKTGYADLRLCEGYVPMYKEMVRISKPLIELILLEYGESEVIRRFSDPFWFQCLATALGFEYNYTGATTVTLKALKEAINDTDLPIRVLGGKGKLALRTPEEIEKISEEFNLSEKIKVCLLEASRLSTKVDNSLIQDSFDIYFHSIIVNERGEFSIINQGMNTKDLLARRYHWYKPKNYFENPHSGVSISNKKVLNLADKKAKETRKAILDLVRDYKPEVLQIKIIKLNKAIGKSNQKTLSDYFGNKTELLELPYYLKFPKKLNIKALALAREVDNFKSLLLTKGVGPSTLRGLAFLASLIYGTELSWKDPQFYCYAHGTKAGKPWYVEKKLMVENAKILEEIVREAKLGINQKRKILRRLAKIVERHTTNSLHNT